MNLDLYEDVDRHEFHYFPYEPGVKNARAGYTSFCGLPPDGLRKAAWFAVGDHRGHVHFERACDTCGKALTV
jgi:hypothetical protein